MTTKNVVASVVDVKPLCQKQSCNLGKCRWRKIQCDAMPALEAAGTQVRSRPYAKLQFVDSKGREREKWVSFSKLEIDRAEIGDHVTVVYRGNGRPYVARPFSWPLAGLGFSISFGGLVLLAGARNWRRAATAEPDGARWPATPRYEHARHEEMKLATTTALHAVPASGAAGPARYQPQRVGAVQRNRGWFG
ncbi:MAG: hypothetical protein KDJ37_05225 [Hyphomicrobiaceae bacterium]|nr:hypothetical protein [Hyphomicrobiaceae bacterium]